MNPNAISDAQRGPPGAAWGRLRGRARAALIGGLIVLVGVAASCVLAAEWRANQLSANRTSFSSTAAGLSSSLGSKLEATFALTRTMRAIATMEPQAGDTRLREWYQQLQRGAPAAPGVVAVLIEPVRASDVSTFRRQAEADPTFRKLLVGRFQIVPPGRRAVYCLTRAIVGSGTTTTSLYPPLLDYCAPVLPVIGRSPYAALIRTGTDTGSFFVSSLPGVAGSLVAVGAAVYRRAAPISTVRARRAALIGFIGTSFNSAALIRSVLVGRQSQSVALYHRNVGGPLQLIARAGATVNGGATAYATRKQLSDGWVAEVTGTAVGSVSPTAQGVVVLVLGLVITLLILLLYVAQSRSRQRAWSLVGQKTEELEYRALHDPLTGLPNRTLVLDRAEQMIARARRRQVPAIALFMDIDNFKQINDRFGHRAGDEVLRRVGARLNSVLRDSDTVGRLGGDEFVMLVDPAGLDAAPELIAERILGLLRQPIALSDPASSSLLVTASIGIALGLPATAEDLLQDADLALYRAKAVGKDGYVLFESAMQTAARDRMHLELDLASALADDQLFLEYQPVLSLETEQVVGVEALLRWRHPTRGVIPPDMFIPIAEDNALIVPIGRWVLEQACVQAAAWRRKGHALSMSVNVSGRQLERTEFIGELRSALHDSGLEPAALTLEITETALMRNAGATAKLLAELKALGARIAVDDFGTGYSSIAYLRQFPVDSLKIDRSFITGLAISGEEHAMTHTLIQLGKALGLETLAEGVEHDDQVRRLQREGCDLAQGFLFAAPLAADALERFLEQRAEQTATVS
jgi:diguanylate cyclase (GGDEF)-like protein